MKKFLMFGLAALCCLGAGAQSVRIKGILHNNRYDDGDQMKSTWIGSLYDENGNYTGTTASIVDQGIYAMTWDGATLSTPAKDPAVNLSEIRQGSQVNYEKAVWATTFNLMYGNSGAVYVDGRLVTVMSRDEQSTPDEELFAVRKWDATTGNLLSNEIRPKSDCLESAGMAYNPKDGKVYGLFYLTEQELGPEITQDPDFFTDQDGESSSTDAGYCICTIDLKTMKVTPVTPGLYYENFVTFAINSEGRAFALTSGGSTGYQDEQGKLRNIDNELTGAQLCEFDLQTGLMKTIPVERYVGTDSAYTEHVNIYPHGTGYSSQYRRQSACFSKSNPNKMYWNGYYNSGKGINSYGSWSSLPDRDSVTGETWRENGKYDTCLYEVDIETGDAVRLTKIANRCAFSCMWVEGDDASDETGYFGTDGIATQHAQASTTAAQLYNAAGQQLKGQQRGLNIVRNGESVRKVMVK